MWRKVCWLLLVLPQWVVAEEFALSAGLEAFRWAEFSTSGRQLLEESGRRYFVEMTGSEYLDRQQPIDFRARLYSGTVEYDGETMTGIPFQTNTDYNGYQAELGLSLVMAEAAERFNARWLLRLALGVDSWRRAIQDGMLADGVTPVSGYVERYTCQYLTLGASYEAEGGWGIGAGIRAPLQTTERIELWGREYVLHPEGQLSLYAGVDVAITRRWSVAVAYDSYRFAKSDPDSTGSYYQPKSEQDTLAAMLQFHF